MKIINLIVVAVSISILGMGLYLVHLTTVRSPINGKDVYISYKLNLSVEDTCKILDCSKTAVSLISSDNCQQPLSIAVLKMSNNSYYVDEVLCG